MRCERVLYTGHPAGSLRSAPVVIPPGRLPGGDVGPGYLILNQADGLDATRLRVYELPLSDPHQQPKELDPDARLEGWTWFRPYYDEEKIAAVSDRGRLGLFGIVQANNKDQALFPMLSPGGLDLSPFLALSGGGASRRAVRARAQVVHAQGDDFWVLANGRLQRINLAWSGRSGPQAVAGWDRALPVGSPLHESQVAEDPRRGRATLFVVTQPLDRQTCVATAVDDEDGTVRWQRQLGLVCLGEPLARTPPGGGGPVLLALDQSGTLFALDPESLRAGARTTWPTGGQSIAGALADNPRVPPVLLPAPDGQTAYEVACPGDGASLLVRQVDFEPGSRRFRVKAERSLPLTAPLAGTPAVVGPWLVLPTAAGTLARVPLPLPEGAELTEGPDWREHLTSPDTTGHVVALSPEVFLTTDGARGLTCWQWSEKTWTSLPPGRPLPGFRLPERITTVPLVLPPLMGSLAGVCVADAGDNLTFLDVDKAGGIRRVRHWELRGPVTAGPFLRHLPGGAIRVGCVVGGNRLVWVDPAVAGYREYTAPTPIVGRPGVCDGLVVVAEQGARVGAEQGGRVVGLNTSTLTPVGPGYNAPGGAIPAASAVAFGAQRVLLPLCDGTAMLVTFDRLLHPLHKVPPVW
jgi:hypothetical protein